MPDDPLRAVGAARTPVREVAYAALRRAILEGHFRDGERLVEGELATKMGVSRTPVREALHKLELEGFVRRRATRGVIVSHVSRQEIEEVFEIRQLIEPYAVGLAVNELADEDLQELERMCRDAARYAASPRAKPERISELNTRFYDLLYRRCPNERLSKLVFDFRDRFIFLDSMISAFSLLDLEERRRGTKQMGPIVEALKRRGRSEVERLMSERLNRLRDAALAQIPDDRK